MFSLSLTFVFFIPHFPDNQVRKVILHNINMLELDHSSFSFHMRTNLIILEVGGWRSARNYYSKHRPTPEAFQHIRNLAIINSTMLNLNQNLFSQDFQPLNLLLRNSVFTMAHDVSSAYVFNLYVFNFNSKLERLVIEGCMVTSLQSGGRIMKATSATVEVGK